MAETARKATKKGKSTKATPVLQVVPDGAIKDRNTRAIRKATNTFLSALRDKPLEEVVCRGVKHAWTVYNEPRVIENPETRRDLPIMRIDLICERGGQAHPIRHETFVVKRIPGTSNEYKVLERLDASYTYPHGYQIPGIPRGVKPSTIIWQEFVRRRGAHVVHSDPREADH